MKRKSLFVWATLVLLGTAGSLVIAQEPKSPLPQNSSSPEDQAKIVEKIVGDYSIGAGKSNGEDIPKDHLADVSVKITEKTITTYDRDKQQQYSASYKLNTDRRPWKILMTVIPKKPADPSATGKAADVEPELSQGLLELSEDGRKLKIIYALPGGETPKDFSGGKRENLFELQRLK